MPNRRDQLQSYQFLLQRVVSAFVTRETDPVRSPFRRAGGATFIGLMVLIVGMAGAGVYGLIRPGGSTRWKVDGAMVVEKETGAVYLYSGEQLYPIVNYASARLLAKPNTTPVSASRNSLAGTSRGPALGIPGAPDSLPAPERMLRGAWTLCSRPALDAVGAPVVRTVLIVGGTVPGGAPLTSRALIVRGSETGASYLLWQDRRHLLGPGVIDALALTQRSRTQVGDAWLDAIPRGVDVVVPPVSGVGAPSTAYRGGRVGQVLRVRSGASTEEFYLVEATTLRPVTPLEAALLVGSSRIAAAYPDGPPAYVDTTPAALGGVPRRAVARPGEDVAAPARLPSLADQPGAAAVCATFAGASDRPRLTADAGPVPTGTSTAGRTGGSRVADEILVEPGRAALVEGLTSPTASAGALALVTDAGLRYGIPDPRIVALLGYGESELVRLPAALVARVPVGPALDPARAAAAGIP